MCSTFENSFSTREQGAPESHFILPNYLVLVHLSTKKTCSTTIVQSCTMSFKFLEAPL
jgi:hypothetical protein